MTDLTMAGRNSAAINSGKTVDPDSLGDNTALDKPGSITIADLASAAYNGQNIAEWLDNTRLGKIGSRCVQDYEADENSRKDWLDKSKKAMDLAKQIAEQKAYPWPKAANVKFPLMTNAVIQFAARAYAAIVTPDPVKVKTNGLGHEQEKRARADRVQSYMSYQVTEVMQDWAEDTDKLLHNIAVFGSCFRKTWFDAQEGRPCSEMMTAINLVINAKARNIDTVPRISEVFERYPYEISERMRSGLWLEVDLGSGDEITSDDDEAPRKFIEQSCLIDLDDDGYPEPYCVVIHVSSQKVLRITPRFDETNIVMRDGRVVKIEPNQYYTHFQFIPDPNGGFYGLGFGHLLLPINDAVNTIINQLIDAGHLANLQGGFIGTGTSGAASGLKGGTLRFPRPGELKPVQMTGADLRQAIVPLQFKEPSPALFQLLGLLIDAGKEISSISDVLTGDAGTSATATTTLALIEQGTKVYTAIYARIHRALKSEFKKLFKLNGTYMNPQEEFLYHDLEGVAYQQDFLQDDMDITPASDPREVADMVRLARANFLSQFLPDPFMEPLELRRRILEAGNVENVDALLMPPQPPAPDPKLQADAALRLAQAEKTEVETNKVAYELAVMGGPVLPQALGDIEDEQMPDQPGAMGGVVESPGDAGVPPAPDLAQGGLGGPAASSMAGGPSGSPGGPEGFSGGNPGIG